MTPGLIRMAEFAFIEPSTKSLYDLSHIFCPLKLNKQVNFNIISVFYTCQNKDCEVKGSLKSKLVAVSFLILTLLAFFNPSIAVRAQDTYLQSTAETPFDTDGRYTISWDITLGAINYALEEASDIDFLGSAEYYPTSNYQEMNSKDGIYFYRVRANIPVNGVDNYTEYLGGILVVAVHIPPPVDITTVILILSFIITTIFSAIDIYYKRKAKD